MDGCVRRHRTAAGVIGLYGIVAQGVLQRTRELAVRAALGASPRSLFTLVLSDGTRLTTLGIAAGTAGSIASVRLLGKMFSGLGYVDLSVCAIAVAALVVAACWRAMCQRAELHAPR